MEKVNITAISIHALRVEGDNLIDGTNGTIAISIHALRVEGDISVTVLSFTV